MAEKKRPGEEYLWLAAKGTGVGCVIVIALLAYTAIEYNFTYGLFLALVTILIGLTFFAESLFVFGAVRYQEEGKFLGSGEIRSSIAISLTVTYMILLSLSIEPSTGLIFRTENAFLQNFHVAYVSVIVFYFGSRVFEEVKKRESDNKKKSKAQKPQDDKK